MVIIKCVKHFVLNVLKKILIDCYITGIKFGMTICFFYETISWFQHVVFILY